MGSMLNHRQIQSQQALRRLRIMANVICNGRVAKLATQSAICTGLTAYYGSCALRRHICSNDVAKGVVYVADVTADAKRSEIAHVERITGTCNTRKMKTRLDLRVRDASTARSDPLAPAHMHRNITAPRSKPNQDPWPPRWRRHTGDPTRSPQRSDGSNGGCAARRHTCSISTADGHRPRRRRARRSGAIWECRVLARRPGPHVSAPAINISTNAVLGARRTSRGHHTRGCVCTLRNGRRGHQNARSQNPRGLARPAQTVRGLALSYWCHQDRSGKQKCKKCLEHQWSQPPCG